MRRCSGDELVEEDVVDNGFTGQRGDVLLGELDSVGVDVEGDNLACGVGMRDGGGDEADRAATTAESVERGERRTVTDKMATV